MSKKRNEFIEKIIAWNINGRSRKKINREANNFIFKNLIKHNPDMIILVEYVPEAFAKLEEDLFDEGYSCFHSDSDSGNGNQILVAYRHDKLSVTNSCTSEFELDRFSPNFFSLNLIDHDTEKLVIIGGIRIKIGGCLDLFEDFKSRRDQFNFLTDKLKNIRYPFAILGDFNNGFFKENDKEKSFVGKPREFYSYPYIKKTWKKMVLKLLLRQVLHGRLISD